MTSPNEIKDYRQLLDLSCTLVITDGNGIIQYANDNFFKISKYSPAELIGHDHCIFSSDFHSKEFISNAQETITGGKMWRGELRNIAKDGSIYWLDATIFPYPDTQGKPNQYVALNVNITDRKLSEEEIIKAYREKEIVLNRISDSVISVDSNWRYTFLNQAALATHPFGLEETLGRVIWDVHPEMKDTIFWYKYHEAMLTGQVVEVESYYLPMNTWFAVKVYPSLDGLTIFYRDITANKEAEREIIKEKNLSESMINSLPGVFYLYDQNRNFIRWNKNFETVSGYSAEEIGRMRPLDFFDTDEKALLDKQINAVFKHGCAEVEANLLTKNRQKIPYYFNGHVAHIGGRDYLLGMGIDITQRKNAENALKESEEKYRYLFNNNPALIIIWDLENFNILEVNDKILEQYGYTRQEFMKMTVLDLRPEEDKEKLKDFAEAMISSNNYRARRTWRHLKKGGETMYMDITSHRIDYNGRECILSLAKDITEQVIAENQLKESYEDIRRLNAHLQTIREDERISIAREIHDELGQQLTVLKMDASWLIKKIDINDSAVQQKLTDMISVINNTVKSVRRISSDLRPGILDDLGLIAALEWQSSEFEKRTGIQCRFTSVPEHIQMEGNVSSGIFRVYQEALTNVLRHADATLVETMVSRTADDFVLSISDNGQGFDMAETKNKKTLGLIGMNERAAMFGGQLNIESKTGQGTTIQLIVPLLVATNNNTV